MDGQENGATGHRVLPHTADLIVEAWGPHRATCIEEAGRALVETFADTEGVRATDSTTIVLGSTLDEDLLVELLEEIVFELDAHGTVPVEITLEETEDGGIAGYFDRAPVTDVVVIGPAPKGVSRSGLAIGSNGHGWHCRAVVDV